MNPIRHIRRIAAVMAGMAAADRVLADRRRAAATTA